MATAIHHPPLSPALQEVLDAHREEARRLRQQHGDPALWLASIVRESFDREALEEAFWELMEGGSAWDDDGPDER